MADWRDCRLGDLGTVSGGGTPSRERAEYWGGPILWITPGELTGNSKKYVSETEDSLSELGLSVSGAKLLPERSLLVTSRASIGSCALTGKPMATNQGFKNLIPRADIYPSYLFHLGRTLGREMTRRASGTTFLEITAHEFERILIRLPPLEEQRRIAEILDAIDETIQATERVITKLELTRSGMREHLCASDESGVAGTTLAGLVEAIVDCPHSTPKYLSHGVLVARTMHIKDGRFLVSDASRVSEDVYRQRVVRMMPSAGDVVLTREAPVGEAFAVPEGMRICLGQRVVLIRPGPELLGQYLVELIYSNQGQRQIRRLVAGTTNPHLNVDEIYHLAFSVPPRHEQSDAIRSFGAIDSRLKAEAQALQKLRRIRCGLAADLLSGRVRTVAA